MQDWDFDLTTCTMPISPSTARGRRTARSGSPAITGPALRRADHEFTTLVSHGTPTPIFLGHFEDKIELEVDDGAVQPVRRQRLRLLGWLHRLGGRTTSSSSPARPTAACTWTTQKARGRSTASRAATSRSRVRGWSSSHWRQYAFKTESGGRGRPTRSRGYARATAARRSRSPAVSARVPALGHERRHARPRRQWDRSVTRRAWSADGTPRRLQRAGASRRRPRLRRRAARVRLGLRVRPGRIRARGTRPTRSLGQV